MHKNICVFGYQREDGSLSDDGLTNELLENGMELTIREQLIRAGVIKQMELVRIPDPKQSDEI